MSIEIARPFLNFYSFPKFPVMEMHNIGNHTGLFNTYMMFSLLCVFCQCGRLDPPMFYVGWVLINPLINRMTSLTNIRGPTRTLYTYYYVISTGDSSKKKNMQST